MMLAIWLLALLGLGVWSLVSYGVHRLLTLDRAQFEDLRPLIVELPFSDELDLWLPGWQTLLQFAIDLTQGLLAGLSSAAPWLAWAVWAIGCAMLASFAALASLALVLYRKAAVTSNQPQRPALPPAAR